MCIGPPLQDSFRDFFGMSEAEAEEGDATRKKGGKRGVAALPKKVTLGSALLRNFGGVLEALKNGLLILAGRLPDCRPDDLVWDYGDRVHILLIAREPVLEECESPDIFRLALPVSGQTVIGSVEMLTQMHRMRMPKRSSCRRSWRFRTVSWMSRVCW